VRVRAVGAQICRSPPLAGGGVGRPAQGAVSAPGNVGLVTSTGDSDPKSQQELFSRLGRDAPSPAVLAVIRAGWAANRRVATATFADVEEGDEIPSALRGGAVSPSCSSMFVALAGSELNLGTGTTTAPTPPVPSDDHFLAPAFVWNLVRELTVDAFFGPILRRAAATLGKSKPVDRHGAAIRDASRRGTTRGDVPGAPRVPRRTARGDTSVGSRRDHLFAALPSGGGRTSTWPSTCTRARCASG
jgi:hypothetical protein